MWKLAAALTGVSLLLVAVFAADADAATSLIAAYDHYVPGQGFDIGLVDLGTGAGIALPAGVNTADDELRPALTPDGRFLLFMRTQVRPLFNGDVIPPDQRKVVMFDRNTGQEVATPLTDDSTNGGAGPAIAGDTSGQVRLAFGLRPPNPRSNAEIVSVTKLVGSAFGPLPQDTVASTGPFPGEGPDNVVDFPEATSVKLASSRIHAYTALMFNPANGTNNSVNLIFEQRTGSSSTVTTTKTFPSAQQPALRAQDGYAAFTGASGPGVVSNKIQTILFPTQTTPDDAPVEINPPTSTPSTFRIETSPAWSPDGSKLAFIRSAPGLQNFHRTLLVYDSEPGVQTIMNAGIDPGPLPPTSQLRHFEQIWGGLSLANATLSNSVALACTGSCVSQLLGARLATATINLSPTSRLNSDAGGAVFQGAKIGILVARIVGTHRLLGRRVPKIKLLGRVPLGKALRGPNHFRWNGKVAGHRLTRGSYLLTYRLVTPKGRVRTVARPVAFRVTKTLRIVSAHRA